MYKALFYKEWIKLRWFILLLIGITFFSYIRIFLNLSAAIELKGGYHLWQVIVQRGAMVYSDVKYILPFAGLVIAIIQFIPETRRRRLRLLFHLPVDHNKSLGFMLLTGFAVVGFLIVLNYLSLIILMSFFFPFEIINSALISASPWFLSAVPAYLGISLAIVEPSWWRKIIYAVAVFLVVLLFFHGGGFNVYKYSLWKYLLLSGFYLLTILLPAFRFKRGLN